jgi:hypothetical protein
MTEPDEYRNSTPDSSTIVARLFKTKMSARLSETTPSGS